MKSGTIVNKNRDFMWRTNGIYETLLRSEICFWKDMIAGCGPAQPLDSLERMQQALALAESRLATLFRDDQQADASDTLNNNSIQRLFHSMRQRISRAKFQITAKAANISERR